MKRLAWFTLLILATLTTAILFWEFRAAVVLFILSLAVAASVRPLVDWFAARGLPRGLALLFTYAICVGGVIALVLILSGPLLANLQQLTKDVISGYEQIQAQWPTGSPLQQSLARQLPAASDVSQAITGPQGGALLQTVLGLTLGSFDLLGQLLIVLVLSMYWSADQEHFKRLWLSLLPFQARARARAESRSSPPVSGRRGSRRRAAPSDTSGSRPARPARTASRRRVPRSYGAARSPDRRSA